MPPPLMTPLRVLVAEDEPAMLSLVTRHLKNLGFSVIEASEGDAAWELAQKHEPDLVILDVMMPGMSGWEICRRIKSEDARFTSTGVIMLTGIGENLNEMTSPLFAADAWLNKPFEFSQLDRRIRETLQRYEKQLPSVTASAQPAQSSPAEKRPAAATSSASKPSKKATSKNASSQAAPGTSKKASRKTTKKVTSKSKSRTASRH